MHQVTVLYGEPTDPEAFDAYYRETHVPLVEKVPGLVSFTTGKIASMDRGAPPYWMMATLGWESEESMLAGLSSPEMGAAGADVANFATGGATLFRAPVTVVKG